MRVPDELITKIAGTAFLLSLALGGWTMQETFTNSNKISVIETDIKHIKSNQAEIKEDLKGIQDDLEEIKSDQNKNYNDLKDLIIDNRITNSLR
jgi:peptidoglycan hydrolase CwlO-like protein